VPPPDPVAGRELGEQRLDASVEAGLGTLADNRPRQRSEIRLGPGGDDDGCRGTASPSSSSTTPRRAPATSLRKSSEFHAWGDSNLYLGRNRDELTLTIEHRAAPAMPAVTLELAQRANALALEVIEPRAPQTPPPSSVDERITTALTGAVRPLAFAELRGMCRVRTASLYERLAALTTAGRIAKSDQGYCLTGR